MTDVGSFRIDIGQRVVEKDVDLVGIGDDVDFDRLPDRMIGYIPNEKD